MGLSHCWPKLSIHISIMCIHKSLMCTQLMRQSILVWDCSYIVMIFFPLEVMTYCCHILELYRCPHCANWKEPTYNDPSVFFWLKEHGSICRDVWWWIYGGWMLSRLPWWHHPQCTEHGADLSLSYIFTIHRWSHENHYRLTAKFLRNICVFPNSSYMQAIMMLQKLSSVWLRSLCQSS